jgi:hypothetical protein
MKIFIDTVGYTNVYIAGDNPQRDGTIVYRSKNKNIEVIVNPRHKVAWGED